MNLLMETPITRTITYNEVINRKKRKPFSTWEQTVPRLPWEKTEHFRREENSSEETTMTTTT